MFGYVRPYEPELKVREAEYYRMVYCGICHALKKTMGQLSTLTLQYDSVFLCLCKIVYHEKTIHSIKKRCAAHPLHKHKEAEVTESFSQTATLCALLGYLKAMDDESDEKGKKKFLAKIYASLTRKAKKKKEYEKLVKELESLLSSLSLLEKEKKPSVDEPADISGKMLSCIFAFGEENDVMAQVGYALGKAIYILDAFDDFEEDVKKHHYNPYICLYGETLTKEQRKDILCSIKLTLQDLEEAMSRLPYDECDPEIPAILNNILYLGMEMRLFSKGEKEEK